MAEGVKFPNVTVPLSDEDGNAFAIVGRVSKALRRAGVDSADIEAYRKEATSGDYDHLLHTTIRTVKTT